MNTFNKRALGILFIILLIGLFIWLNNSKNKNKDVDDNIVTKTEETIIEETKDYKISITYPILSNNDTIAKYVLGTVDAFKVNASNPERFIPDSACHQYELDGQYKKVESKSKGTVSYIYSMYEFTCGAHGNTAVATFNFKTDGTVITSDNLFVDSDSSDEKMIEITRKILRPKLLTALAKNSNIPENEYPTGMLDDGLGLSCFNENNVFVGEKCGVDGFLFAANLNTFYITDDGIVFVYGQYQIAPYSSGVTEILVSWDEIGPYLK